MIESFRPFYASLTVQYDTGTDHSRNSPRGALQDTTRIRHDLTTRVPRYVARRTDTPPTRANINRLKLNTAPSKKMH